MNHSTNPPESGQLPRIGVLERNRSVAQRVARVLRAASNLADVACESDPATLRSMLSEDLRLLACDASDLDLAIEWASSRYPSTSVMVWTSGDMGPLLEAARNFPRLSSLVGWPSFSSMPRPWELALAARRVVDSKAASPRLNDIFTWGATVMKFRPRTSAERDFVVSEAVSLAERAGAQPRTAQRVGEVAHELLMNAMYDAPADASGTGIYAHDRKADIELADREVPTFRFGSDGVQLALQVVDPFGRLRRDHVLDGVLRGRSGGGADVIDTSGGGAGLGLARIYTQSSMLVVDVAPTRFTSVTAFFDTDVNPREARTLPVSLHLFHTDP